MTSKNSSTVPSLDDVTKVKDPELQTFSVKSELCQGFAGMFIESSWKIHQKKREISFTSAHFVSKFNKIPLTAYELPDRHLRAVRRFGAIRFDKKRFDGLVLYQIENMHPYAVVTAELLGEERVFDMEADARLWFLREGTEEGTITPQQPTPKMKQEAVKNSTDIRIDALRALLDFLAGERARARLTSLLARGYDPMMLATIWKETYEDQDLPEGLAKLLRYR